MFIVSKTGLHIGVGDYKGTGTVEATIVQSLYINVSNIYANPLYELDFRLDNIQSFKVKTMQHTSSKTLFIVNDNFY